MIAKEEEIIERVVMDAKEFERMKNCVNCDHNEVCVVVARRKAQKAGDYTPCSKWKLVGNH